MRGDTATGGVGRALTLAVGGALCASGAASLAFKGLWFRQARLAFGASHWATAVVMAAFMLGLACGGGLSTLFDRLGLRARSALWLCAALQIWLAVVGAVLVWLLPVAAAWQAPLDAALIGFPWLVQVLRLGHAELLLLWPTLAIGCLLPLAVRGLRDSALGEGGSIGFVYASNLSGAALGGLVCEGWLVAHLGVLHAGVGCGAMALIACGLFVFAARQGTSSPAPLATVSPLALPAGPISGAERPAIEDSAQSGAGTAEGVAEAPSGVERATPQAAGTKLPRPQGYQALHGRAVETDAPRKDGGSETGGSSGPSTWLVPAPTHSLAVTAGLSAPSAWLIAGIGGLLLWLLQLVWFRLLGLFLPDTPYVRAVVLGVLLASLGVGAAVAGAWLQRGPGAYRHGPLWAVGAGLWSLIGLHLFPHALLRFFAPHGSLAVVGPIAVALQGATGVCFGALFTLVAAGRAMPSGAPRAIGELTASQGLGAACGAVLGPLVLLPGLGMEGCLLLLAGLTLVSAPLAGPQLGLRALRLPAVALLAGLVLFPFGAIEQRYIRGSMGRWMGAGDRIVTVREGRGATLVHVQHRARGLPLFDQLATDAYAGSDNGFAARRVTKLLAYLPLALHPRVERALVIGYGVGSSAAALAGRAELQELVIVEPAPERLALGRSLTYPGSKDPLADPRVFPITGDGRHYLAAGGGTFDLITGEPPSPWLTGAEYLYSREFFALVRARLSEGGVASYRLPLMHLSSAAALSIVAAFCDAFDDCSLWHGSGEHFVLLGARGARGQTTTARLFASWSSTETRAELSAIGLEHPVQFGPLFVGDARFLAGLTADAPPLSDGFPQRVRQGQVSLAERQPLLQTLRDTEAARQRFAESPLIGQRLPEAARRAMLGQFEYQRLINGLLFPGPSRVRSAAMVRRVLRQTPWSFPVLLLLGSDSDMQAAMHRAGQLPLPANGPPNRHHLAAALAYRDLQSAQAILARLPPQERMLSGLQEVLARLVRHESAGMGASAAHDTAPGP